MENNFGEFKKSWAKAIAFCLFGLVFMVASLYFIIFADGWAWFGVVYIIFGIYLESVAVGEINKVYKKYHEMKTNIPTIQSNYAKAKEELLSENFISNEHISSYGYKYLQYRNRFNAIDNLHIEIDYDNKKLAYYTLLPYMLEIKDFNQIVSVELIADKKIKSGKVFYKTIDVKISFDDDKSFELSASDNMSCYENDKNYSKHIQDANLFIEIIEKLKKEQ